MVKEAAMDQQFVFKLLYGGACRTIILKLFEINLGKQIIL